MKTSLIILMLLFVAGCESETNVSTTGGGAQVDVNNPDAVNPPAE